MDKACSELPSVLTTWGLGGGAVVSPCWDAAGGVAQAPGQAPVSTALSCLSGVRLPDTKRSAGSPGTAGG